MTPPPDATPDLDPTSDEADDEFWSAQRSEPLDTLLARRLTTRQRTVRVGLVIGTLLIALALLVSLVPDLRQSVQLAVLGPTPTPTFPIPTGGDAIWFTPLAPGETLTLDGRPLSNVPQQNDTHPLHIFRGTHLLTWKGGPFSTQTCIISVPRSPTDTCPVRPAPLPTTALDGRLIDVSESLATLSDPLRLSLTNAISAALATSYTTTVHQGQYFRTLNVNAFTPALSPTTQPLQASLQFVQQSGWSEPCAVTSIVACRAQGQDCELLCTLGEPLASADPNAWYVGLTAGLLWTFTVPNGQIIVKGAPDTSFNYTLLTLRITWDGAHWGVIPMLGNTPGLAAAQDAICGSLANDLDAWVQLDASRPFVNVRNAVTYASDGDPTDGCAATISAISFGNTDAPTPTASPHPLLIHRFGVLLAANPAAHALWPGMPVADAAESALATRLIGA